MKQHRFAFYLSLALVTTGACASEDDLQDPEEPQPAELEESSVSAAVTCTPRMSMFPVAVPHNIGYDAASCGSGTCATSCPDIHANSDWNGPAGHHGIDIFAYRGAPLVAVADGTIVAVGTPSSTSGLRVRLRDACGWEYYYGHLDSARVSVGQQVKAGSVIGLMGNTGTSGVHTHFNVSPDGNYNADINPFTLLRQTSNSDCGGGFYPLQRHHNAFTTEHYYSFTATTNGAFGFSYEGTEGRMSRTQQTGTVALHAMSKSGLGHFYTTSAAEVSARKAQGYVDEGVLGWVYPASASTGKPIYFYENAFVSDWLYTQNPIPNGAFGYALRGVAWRSP
ncbi:MAG: peptidoglycan DD-metalloendopeptidase family protein [Kofleriaceae bacterium]